MSTLNIHTHVIQKTLGIPPYPSHNLNTVLETWLGGGGNVHPTWKNILMIIHKLHLDDLAKQIETCLSGGTMEQHHEERESVAEEESETI